MAFDRVMVINLKRQPERLERLRDNWPSSLPQPVVMEAVDAHNIIKPVSFKGTVAQYANVMSHLHALDMAMRLMRPDGTALILEDDAQFVEWFDDGLRVFLHWVPRDWDVLMLGGEHLTPSESVSTSVQNIRRCVRTSRNHAYAIRYEHISVLVDVLSLWNSVTSGATMAMFGRLNTYAPRPWLVGQAAGVSEINGLDEPERFWNE